MKIIIFGTTGLIGNSIFNYLKIKDDLSILGSSRLKSIQDLKDENLFYFDYQKKENFDEINKIIKFFRPNLVVNCIGITKHIKKFNRDDIINLNSIFPNELKKICNDNYIKVLQVSTDCVFLGNKGNYVETDTCDAKDIYGISKANGELDDEYNLTIRISTIGREQFTSNGLLEWFLNQNDSCQGYKNAFFSGITTYELSNILYNYIFPNLNNLTGTFHISGEKINKFKLLQKFSKKFNKKIKIIPNYDYKIDRSLNSFKFIEMTGYQAKSWDEMLEMENI